MECDDSNDDWFDGPAFEEWKYEAMPSVLPETQNIVSKVRGSFPNAIVFKDNHKYFNQAHASKLYGVGEAKSFISQELLMITGDYQKYQKRIIGFN
jgi:hypothetical protein